MQNSVGEPYGLGEYIPHCCAGLGDQNALRECIEKMHLENALMRDDDGDDDDRVDGDDDDDEGEATDDDNCIDERW